jgi:hypothetical protein
MKYRLLMDLEVTEFTQQLPKRVRDELFAHFRRIRDFPSRYSDYHFEKIDSGTSSGRSWEEIKKDFDSRFRR